MAQEEHQDKQEKAEERADVARLDPSKQWNGWLESSGQLPEEDTRKRTAPLRWFAALRERWREWKLDREERAWVRRELRLAEGRIGWRERWEEWRLERAERARRRREERLAAGTTGWRRAWDEWCLERAERARLRREQREAERVARLEARELSRARTAERVAEVRTSVEQAIRFGILERLGEALRTRRLTIATVVVLMLLSAVTGALLMRYRHRRYLVGALVAVNGVVIRRDQFFDEMVARHGMATLNLLVERELRRQFIRAHGAEASDMEVEQRYRLEAKMPEFHRVLASYNITELDYRASLKRVLSEINLFTQGVEVTPAEVREFYRRNVSPNNLRSLFYSPPRVSLAVIVTPDPASAKAAAAALKAGTPFGDVAARYSVHDSATRGGLVEPFYLGRSYVALSTGMDAIARDLQEGQQVGPVQIGRMWWIARCLQRTPAVTRPFEEVKETAEILARLSKGILKNKARLDAEYEKFRSGANIQRFAAR